MTEEQNIDEWQAPPPPEKIQKEEPEMSEIGTIFNIFIEPGKTFEDLRKKPRFILASVLLALLATTFMFGLYFKVGEEGYRRFAVEQLDKNPQTANLDAEAKNNAVNVQMVVISAVRYAMPIIVIVSIIIGGLLYFAGGRAFGGDGSFFHGISVWVYSSIPPAIVSMLANVVVLIFKSPDEINLAESQRGLVQANLGFLVDGKTMPVLATILSVADLFLIWGWILAAIGLQKTNKISAVSAWTITVILALIGIAGRVIGAYTSGTPS